MNAKSLPIIGAFVFAVAIGSFAGIAYTTRAARAANNTTNSTANTDTLNSTTASATSPPTDQPDPSKGGHVANGITETVLTGDTAEKAKAAALAAVPGGTIERVENDAEGATYEAHLKKSDGTKVTVFMDANFNITSTENGPSGRGGR